MNWHATLTAGNDVNNTDKPAVAPTIAQDNPNRMPNKKGTPFLTPYVAPVAANAKGAGPGDPNNNAVAVINDKNDSIN